MTAPFLYDKIRWEVRFVSMGYAPEYTLQGKSVNYIQVKLRCPSSNKTIGGIQGAHTDWWNYIGGLGETYGWNPACGYSEGAIVLSSILNAPLVKKPSLRIIVGDRAEGLTSLAGSIDGAYRPLGDVHLTSTPIGFLDGHVQAMSPRKVNPPGTIVGISNPDGSTNIACTPANSYGSSDELKYMWAGGSAYRY
ncbi:MAG: hypothetical protein LBM70_02640 [Victivallales bacterium]|nr:hypothetical protein [Victivallales bacterium]